VRSERRRFDPLALPPRGTAPLLPARGGKVAVAMLICAIARGIRCRPCGRACL